VKSLKLNGRGTRKESGCRPTRCYTLVPDDRNGGGPRFRSHSRRTRIPPEIPFAGSRGERRTATDDETIEIEADGEGAPRRHGV